MQPSPDGLAQAFIIGREFVGNEPSALILGDNIFYGHDFEPQLREANAQQRWRDGVRLSRARSERYGVVEFDAEPHARSASKKSRCSRNRNYAVTGLYFYDNQVFDIAADIKPSARGELEITDVNRVYLERNALNVEVHGPRHGLARHRHARIAARGVALHRHDREAAGPESRVPGRDRLPQGYIDAAQLERLAEPLKKNGYGQYLLQIAARPRFIDRS